MKEVDLVRIYFIFSFSVGMFSFIKFKSRDPCYMNMILRR